MRLIRGDISGRDGWLAWSIGAGQLLSWGAFYYSLPVFVAPISESLGWSRQLLFAGLSVALLTAVLTAPLIGREIDRGNGRRAMLSGQLLGTVSVAALATVQSAPMFLLLCCALGVSQAATLYDAAFSILHRRLGSDAPAAIIRVTLIAGFAGTVFVPAAQYSVDYLGWRNAALIIAIAGALAFVLTATTVPAELAQPKSDPSALPSDSVPAYWTPAMIAAVIAFAASTGVFSTVTIHFLPLLIDRGVAGLTAAYFFALVGPSQIAARFLLFLAPPRAPALRFGVWVFVLQGLAVTLLMVASGGAPLLAFALIFGASSGLLTIVRGLAPAEICDRTMIGRLNGAIGAVGGLARAAMPALFALGLAQLGSLPALGILLALSILGAAGFAAIGPLERRRASDADCFREAVRRDEQ